MPIGPSRPLNLAKPESIDIRQAARYFGARGEADSATLTLLEKCAAPLLAAATPRAVWLEADVESLTQAGILKGEDIFRHLEGCSEAVLLAVTVGPGVDGQIRRAGVGDIAAGVAEDRADYYGFTEEFIITGRTSEALLENAGKKYAPSRSQLSGYLADNGCFYGRCISIGYDTEDSEDGWYGRTEAEARQLALTVRREAITHLRDDDYFGYLGWKYDDGYHDAYEEPDLLSVDSLSQADQTALRNLPVGSLSNPISEKAWADDYGTINLYLKDDPAESEDFISSLGSVAVEVQLSQWAEKANVTATAAYDGLRIPDIAARVQALSA